jgi:ectoine hydroxylase-related dioxygenase (phytanoyl-CoA dioxygenase family)
MTPSRDLREQFEAEGRLWLRAAVPEPELARLEALTSVESGPGARLSLSEELVGVLSGGELAASIAQIQPAAKAVRIVAFKKSAQSNWGVPWHQDRVIAVRQKQSVPGFINWSRKSGIWHCEPPAAFLDGMVFARVHLDPTDESNGAMEVALGSHRHGLVASAEAARTAGQCPSEIGTANRGDVLILKMLTLHRSRPARTAAPRRVLRIDYACSPLPQPLEWA